MLWLKDSSGYISVYGTQCILTFEGNSDYHPDMSPCRMLDLESK